MNYNFSLEITVKNATTSQTETIDLFIGTDDVKEDLIGMITDEQIQEELGLDKPDRADFENDEEYDEAIEAYEEELEEAISDYKDDIEFSNFDSFLSIIGEDGDFKAGFNDFEDVENILGQMEGVDSSDWRAVMAIYNSTYNDLSQAIDTYNSGDYYWYPDMSMEDVVEEQIDNGIWGEIPDNIRNYLDTEAMARDLSHDGYSYDDEANGVIAVF